MKLTIFLVTIAFLQVSATAFSQKISLKEKNVSIDKVLSKIQDQSGYEFFYNASILKQAGKVSIDIKDASVEKALDILFKNKPFAYSVDHNTITIKEKAALPASSGPAANITVRGYVLDETGKPMEGATIRIKGDNFSMPVSTGSSGGFSIIVPGNEAVLMVSYVGYQTKEVSVSGADVDLVIHMEREVGKLNEVTVVSTGYQSLPKERATGSFEKIDNALFNRVTGPDVISRLNGIVPGLLFDQRDSGSPTLGGLTIRGVSTLTDGLTSPLIVLDNFPYDGDVNNINPNDIESVTILKDAAAASIWGARAGNGVIVITTKKGRYDKAPQVSFNSNVTIAQKPDLFYLPQMRSSDYIDVEKMLFSKGFYDDKINDIYTWPYLSPVVELLNQARNGSITDAAANAQIDALRKQDVRNDFLKYIYRPAVSQQYALNISGGGKQYNYLVAGGYDYNRANIVKSNDDRLSLRSEFSYKPTSKLEIQAGMMYTKKNPQSVPATLIYSQGLLPYTQLADAQGNPMVVGKGYRAGFLDTVGNGKLLDWKYRPLAELDASSQTIKTHDMLLNLGASYQLSKVFSADVKYQYAETTGDYRNWKGPDAWDTRDLINKLTQYQGGQVFRPVPLGGILEQNNSSGNSYNIRGQINANKTWNGKHQLAAIAGVEERQVQNRSDSHTVYGYDKDLGTYQNVDFVDRFPTLFYDQIIIPSGLSFIDQTYRYTSIYANASYTYDGRYIVSASARKDASNLYGVATNQKGVPLWSGGVAWNISREHFYHSELVPELKLRATFGYQGNTDNSQSAFSVIQYLNDPNIYNGLAAAYIKNPSNPALRWEKVSTLNLGLDFGFKNNRLSGTIEYYNKHTTDALSQIPVDETTGFFAATLNNAALAGKGLDLQLHSLNLAGAFQWNTDFILSYNTNKVTKYVPASVISGSNLVGVTYSISPIQGKPAYNIFSYKWAGLDPQTGDPMGYVDGVASKDYATLINPKLSDMQYDGSAVPVYFGSLRNTFTWKNISVSANIMYKLGYYFRRAGLSYGALFGSSGNAIGVGHADFSKRWQKPGDEKFTDVPSMIYPDNEQRDRFYAGSTALVSRADNIRLQDITFSYSISKPDWYLKNIRFYANMSNLGIIWRANKQGLDPDYGSSYPAPRTMSLGISTNF